MTPGMSEKVRGIIYEKSKFSIFLLILGQIHVYAGRGTFKGTGPVQHPNSRQIFSFWVILKRRGHGVGDSAGPKSEFFMKRGAKSIGNQLSTIPTNSERPTPIIEKGMLFYMYLFFFGVKKTKYL